MSDLLRQNNDFFVCNGDYVISEDGTAVLQRVVERLQSFNKEWFLNSEGLPYLTDIWGKAISHQAAYTLILSTITETPGVAFVDSFDINLDTETREYQVRCFFRSIYSSAQSLEVCLQVGLNHILDTARDSIRDLSRDSIRDTS